ncbi:tetratricopeptide repeat protein [Corallococcus praedator]|uniref:tetratricopeptide repeat protein n=1 Tax=Corallococcus praedator TaxID=2316724 RepID=UPI0034E0A03B
MEGRVVGSDHVSTLHATDKLGVLYYDRGKLRKAEQMCQRALVGRKNDLVGTREN